MLLQCSESYFHYKFLYYPTLGIDMLLILQVVPYEYDYTIFDILKSNHPGLLLIKSMLFVSARHLSDEYSKSYPSPWGHGFLVWEEQPNVGIDLSVYT